MTARLDTRRIPTLVRMPQEAFYLYPLIDQCVQQRLIRRAPELINSEELDNQNRGLVQTRIEVNSKSLPTAQNEIKIIINIYVTVFTI